MTPLATLDFETRDPYLVAKLDGAVDLSNVEEIRAMLVASVSHDVEGMVLDLRRTTYLDSTGVRLLFELAESLQSRRQVFVLVVTPDAIVHRVLCLTQLDARVPVHASLDAALQALDV